MQAAISKSKYALLRNEKDLSDRQKEKLTAILENFPDLAEKHKLKEQFKTIFDEKNDWYSGILKLADWMRKAKNHYGEFIGTLKRWFGELISYFDRRTTNGLVEGINNKLKVIKRMGYGFRNLDNFKNRCLLEWHFNYYFSMK